MKRVKNGIMHAGTLVVGVPILALAAAIITARNYRRKWHEAEFHIFWWS